MLEYCEMRGIMGMGMEMGMGMAGLALWTRMRMFGFLGNGSSW